MDENNQNIEIPSPELKKDESSDNVGMAAIAYIVFFIPLLTDYKNDEFIKFHVKQSLLIFVSYLIFYFLRFFPLIGGLVWIISPIIYLSELALMVIGIFNALRREKKELPFIGKYAEGLYNFLKKVFTK